MGKSAWTAAVKAAHGDMKLARKNYCPTARPKRIRKNKSKKSTCSGGRYVKRNKPLSA